jgi:hypothetical protein
VFIVSTFELTLILHGFPPVALNSIEEMYKRILFPLKGEAKVV